MPGSKSLLRFWMFANETCPITLHDSCQISNQPAYARSSKDTSVSSMILIDLPEPDFTSCVSFTLVNVPSPCEAQRRSVSEQTTMRSRSKSQPGSLVESADTLWFVQSCRPLVTVRAIGSDYIPPWSQPSIRQAPWHQSPCPLDVTKTMHSQLGRAYRGRCSKHGFSRALAR